MIDAHTHICDSLGQFGSAAVSMQPGHTAPWDRHDAGPDLHADATQAAQYVFILGLVSEPLGADITTQSVADHVAAHPDKLLGFACINPTDAAAVEALEQVRTLKLAGVTISPAAQHFHPADPDAMRFYEVCQRAQMPIIVQTAATFGPAANLAFAQPWMFDQVATRFGDLKLVISEMGGPWTHQTLTLLAKHQHVYADLAGLAHQPWGLYQVLVAAHEQGILDRLLPASGFPRASSREMIEAVYHVAAVGRGAMGDVLPNIPRQALEGLVERDALALLGIAQPQAIEPQPSDKSQELTSVAVYADVEPEEVAQPKVRVGGRVRQWVNLVKNSVFKKRKGRT